MVVEFRLLGGVEVLADGRMARIGHTRERMVLIALVMDLNRPVGVSELIDRVWGDRLPQRPRAALYGYLSRVRRVTAALDGVELRKQSNGYLLEADPATVDLYRFDQLMTRARADDDDAAALHLITEALELWHGQPLAGADTPWLVALREDLGRRRRMAELDRDDILLRLGRHEEVLAGTSTHADEVYWDERRAGQYMLALYRCGRQADALTHYERVRTRLAEELGADPTPELRHLHQQILTTDPALDHVAHSNRSVVPRQLPMTPQSFVGRTSELAALDDLLIPGARRTVVVSAVCGAGGIGKTWLAVHWAHRHAEKFPDGQLYVNLRGFDPVDEPLPVATALRGFLDALGVDPGMVPGDLDAQAALYRSLVADRRILVVLDNARDTAHVTPLLPGGPHCGTLITSRHLLSGLTTAHGVRSLVLDMLDATQARDVLACHLGSARVTAEPDAVAELLRYCAGLPLALGIVAARAASHPEVSLTALAAELRDFTARLDAFDAGEMPANLRAAFTASYRMVDDQTASTFRLLGLVPGEEIGLAAAAALTDLPIPRIRVILRELESRHLLRQEVAGRYRMHDLVRLYAAELVSAHTSESEAALDRLLRHHLYAASVAADAFEPNEAYRRPPIPEQSGPAVHLDGFIEARDWLDTERSTLLATAHATAHRQPHVAVHLSTTLFRYLDVGGHYHEALALHTAAATARGHARESHILACRGYTLFRLGRYEDALADTERALELTDANDPVGEIMASNTLGTVRATLGDLDRALHHFHRALDRARSAGQALNEAIAQYNLGDTYRRAKRYDTSADYLAQALAYGGLDRYVLTSLGDLHRDQGNPTDALKHYQRALDLARDDADRGLQAQILIDIGDLTRTTGNPDQALTHYQRALELAEETHYPTALAGAHHGLALTHHHLGNHAQTLHHAESASALQTNKSSPEAVAIRTLVAEQKKTLQQRF